jgi:hypothetical protein
MYEYQRRLLNEAAKYGKLSPKETINFPEECQDFIVEGVKIMPGAEKAVMSSGSDVPTFRRLLKVLQNRPTGHAFVLDVTTPTGPGARRGNLTGEGSEMKIVKISEIGKFELRGYNFPSIKPGAKASRTWQDHKGEATIIAVNESVQEEVENLHEFDSEFKQNAKHNLAMSTKLAKKKNADHDSQWGVGFRAYCRAVISGNAVNINPPKDSGLKSGWNDARQMIAMGRRLKEEVEHLEEGAVKSELEGFLYGLPNPVVTALKKMGDLKGKEKDIRALLVKHKAKLMSGKKSRRPSMNMSVMAIVQYFADMFQESYEEEGVTLSEMIGKEAHKILGDVVGKKAKLKVVKPTSLSTTLKVGTEYSIHTGTGGRMRVGPDGKATTPLLADKMWVLSSGAGGRSGNLLGTNIAKAIKRGELQIVKEEVEQVEEAYAPQWAYNQRKINPILGQFRHNGITTEYRAIDPKNPGGDWAKSHGLTHEIFIQPIWNNFSDTRFAIVKGSVVHVCVDEGEGGKPVINKWPITSHKKYPLPNG